MADSTGPHYKFKFDDAMISSVGRGECMIRRDFNEYGWLDGNQLCDRDNHESCEYFLAKQQITIEGELIADRAGFTD